MGLASCAKVRVVYPLRARSGASTIDLFSLASFPRWPSAPQAVPGGAMNSDNGSPIRKIYIFSPKQEWHCQR